MQVAELWIYPIKSCRGIPVDELELDDRGPANDRRWMLVDEDGCFFTQREVPRLSLVDVALDNGDVVVSSAAAGSVRFPQQAGHSLASCRVWHDQVELLHVDREVDAWFSSFLGVSCRLMRMPRETERVIDPDYSPERRLVSLADAFPMLLIGDGSLTLLNQKLTERGENPIPMRRFRPNVVVSGTEPHEEDGWKRIRIGELACAVVKPCARCTTTTVDVETGVKGAEPLRTLASYRKRGSKVYFGQNVIHMQTGTIKRGDSIVPVDRRAPVL